MKVLFFGSLREQLGTSELNTALPDGIDTIGQLLASLQAQGDEWKLALGTGNVLFAVNQDMVDADTTISDSDEVALFPPVTGG
ncbi:MAG: molybdopterin converting factor subunit 1 [Porticoccaceae bacterium]|nr:MAG: molybdopterin converting factor subunit 1 [Porticoccaceae bacterium]